MANSLLSFGLFRTALALTPNFKVERVSRTLKGLGDTFRIRAVLLFPPRLSYKILVNLLSRWGTCRVLKLVNWSITLPRAVKLVFILIASSILVPCTLLQLIFSDPARSTKCSFPFLIPGFPYSLVSKVSIKIAWDLLEVLLRLVTALSRFAIPYSNTLMTSWKV